jgi:DamX protein
LKISPTPPTEEVRKTEEIPAVVAEQPSGDGPGKTRTAASPDAETPKTLVVANDTYALQLIGFYSLDALLNFADRNDLPQRLYYREETANGRPWFALIHSLHKDYASAEAQLEKLSAELVALDPWIRPLDAGVELMVLEAGSQR